MGCVQSLFNTSKSRSSSPDRDVEPSNFEKVPVTQKLNKSYNTSATGISVANDRVYSNVKYDEDSDDDMALKCEDFERYALDIEDDQRSVHYVEATALTTLAANSSSVAILGMTAKCKSAGVSPAIRRQRSSSPSSSASSLPTGPRPPLIGSASQSSLECSFQPPVVRDLAADTGTAAAVSSTTEKEPQDMWLSEEQWAAHLRATKSSHRAARSLTEDTGPPPPSPSPFSTASIQWPLKWPVSGCSKQSNLDHIPVGVIEVLDCEPLDQRRPPPKKAQRLPRAQRVSRDQNIPLPVIHAMEMKSNSLGHEELFKTMRVQPPSSDKHGFRSRTGTGSSTFDSSSRKPFLRQSNESKFRYTDDEFAAATGWMTNMPVFAKCPPAKSKSLPTKDSISSTTAAEVEMTDKQHGVHRGSSLPYDNSGAETTPKLTKRNNDKVAEMVPIALEFAAIAPGAIDKLDSFNKSNDHKLDVTGTTEKICPIDEPNEVQPELKAEKVQENSQVVDQKIEKDVEEVLKNQEHGGAADTNNSSDSKDQEPELETEYRLTMIHSVREAVNKICEQAVEKTAAIVRGMHKRNSNVTLMSSLKDRDHSEITDNASSEFSLPPPPQQHPLDSGLTGQESSWPPPPEEEEEQKTIAPGFSFDLPDPPTEIPDQMDSENDQLDISDEEMKATGLPSDDTDTEAGDGAEEIDRPGNEIDTVMKSTANGGSSDGSVEAATVVAQDSGADDRAATTIQAVYRGFRARKYVEAVNAAAVKIQAGFRGYRVRQSLKNAAPSTATTTTDDSQCWSDDDQKSVVSVTYAPLKEYENEPRGSGDGQGDDGDGPSPDAGISNSVSGVPGDVGGGDVRGGGDGDGHSGAGNIGGAHVGAGVGVGGVGGVGVYEDEDDDEDQLQTGDDEVFERDDKDIGGGGGSVGNLVTNPITTITGPDTPTEESTLEDAAKLAEAAEEEELVKAAIKIQARVRGFAARKRLNNEKNNGADKK